MIKLDDFIIEIDGKKYVPLEVAQTAQSEGIDIASLDDAINLITNSVNEINKSVNDSLNDD